MMRVAASRSFWKKTLQDVNHELHGRVVVVEDQNPVEAGLLGLGFRARNDGRAATGLIAVAVTLHPHHACRGSQT